MSDFINCHPLIVIAIEAVGAGLFFGFLIGEAIGFSRGRAMADRFLDSLNARQLADTVSRRKNGAA